jgi:predicted MPP superfamily phosphohydrolase
VIVDPTIQISVDAAVKFTDGYDVALLGGCADINDDDKVTQVSEQAANQVVHKNNDLEDGVLAVDPTIQQISVQTAANVNTDNDVYIVLGCHDGNVKISDNDKVTQVSEQAANQEALTDSDGPTIQQISVQTAANHNEDNDRTVYIGSLNL